MEAILFSLTVIYIAIEAKQALNLTKAQYGHSLTQRMYDRYLSSAQNTDFAMFMAKNTRWPTMSTGDEHSSG